MIIVFLFCNFSVNSQEKDKEKILYNGREYIRYPNYNYGYFPIPEKENKKFKIQAYQAICDYNYLCSYKLYNRLFEIHQFYAAYVDGVGTSPAATDYIFTKEYIRKVEEKEPSVIFQMINTFFIKFYEGRMIVYYYSTKKGADFDLIQAQSNFDNFLSQQIPEMANLYGLVVDEQIINVFPKKPRVLDMIELEKKKGYYFLILATPYMELSEYEAMRSVPSRFEIYVALVKKKQNKAKLIVNKFITTIDETSYVKNLKENKMDGNRVISFNTINKPDWGTWAPPKSTLHLIWLGKY